MEDLAQQIQDHERRIQALENAPKPVLHNTPKTNPFMRPTPPRPPVDPADPAYVAAFGQVFGDGGRLMTKAEQVTWERRRKAWGGKTDMPDSEAVAELLDHYTLLGQELKPEAIIYGGTVALVFKAAGLGYGTPQCYVLGVGAIEHAYGEAERLDRLVELIEQERAKA